MFLRSAGLLAAAGALSLAGCSNGRDDAYYEREAAVMAAQAEGTELKPASNERADAAAPRDAESEPAPNR